MGKKTKKDYEDVFAEVASSYKEHFHEDTYEMITMGSGTLMSTHEELVYIMQLLVDICPLSLYKLLFRVFKSEVEKMSDILKKADLKTTPLKEIRKQLFKIREVSSEEKAERILTMNVGKLKETITNIKQSADCPQGIAEASRKVDEFSALLACDDIKFSMLKAASHIEANSLEKIARVMGYDYLQKRLEQPTCAQLNTDDIDKYITSLLLTEDLCIKAQLEIFKIEEKPVNPNEKSDENVTPNPPKAKNFLEKRQVGIAKTLQSPINNEKLKKTANKVEHEIADRAIRASYRGIVEEINNFILQNELTGNIRKQTDLLHSSIKSAKRAFETYNPYAGAKMHTHILNRIKQELKKDDTGMKISRDDQEAVKYFNRAQSEYHAVFEPSAYSSEITRISVMLQIIEKAIASPEKIRKAEETARRIAISPHRSTLSLDDKPYKKGEDKDVKIRDMIEGVTEEYIINAIAQKGL